MQLRAPVGAQPGQVCEGAAEALGKWQAENDPAARNQRWIRGAVASGGRPEAGIYFPVAVRQGGSRLDLTHLGGVSLLTHPAEWIDAQPGHRRTPR